MNKRTVILIGLLLLSIIAIRRCLRQDPADNVVYDQGLLISIDKRMEKDALFALLKKMDIESLNVDSLFEFGSLGALQELGWTIYSKNEYEIRLFKPFDPLEAGYFPKGAFFAEFLPGTDSSEIQEELVYGINSFDGIMPILEVNDTISTFRLLGFKDSKSVFLTGTFNDWSTLSHPMKRTDVGWEIQLSVSAGKHLYKFLINESEWITDPQNSLTEFDEIGQANSVYFKPNHRFRLKNSSEFKEVFVVGSFNNWEAGALRLFKLDDQWELPIFLKEGTHYYKFVIDGKWELDPGNQIAREDGQGNTNSVLSVGKPIQISLNGFPQATEVYVAGSFNQWNFNELKMKQIDGSWKLPIVLAQGNYEYKFKVDDRYIIDPDNSVISGTGQFQNSVLIVRPNHVFKLQGFLSAKQVAVSGSFNNWAETGYAMHKTDEGWQLPVVLKKGKNLYKIIVDNQWILDPDNPYFEENQYGTGNSVVWK